ncbi:MAG: hypothetical protein AB1631_27980 [Acidobacteriota bacterium]
MKKLACLVLIALVVNSTAAAFQKPAADWSAVRALVAGSRLSVRLKDGKKIEGLLVSVSDSSLTLTRNNQAVELDQPNIAKVYHLIPRSAGKSAARSALIGAGIGFGAGVGAGGAIGSYEDIQTLESMAVLGSVGAAIGAVVGLFKGLASKHRRSLIYDAK